MTTIFYGSNHTVPLNMVQGALYLPCDEDAPNGQLTVHIDLHTGHRLSLYSAEASDFWKLYTKEKRKAQALANTSS